MEKEIDLKEFLEVAELIHEARGVPKEVIEELSPARRFQFVRVREDVEYKK